MSTERPTLTVDIVIHFSDGSIVLIRRGKEPCLGQWALPGGRMEVGESLSEAAIREAKEETGLDVRIDRLVGVYSNPLRDPRRHTVSVAFFATPIGGILAAATDAKEILRTNEFLKMQLAFDHNQIVRDSLQDQAAIR